MSATLLFEEYSTKRWIQHSRILKAYPLFKLNCVGSFFSILGVYIVVYLKYYYIPAYGYISPLILLITSYTFIMKSLKLSKLKPSYLDDIFISYLKYLSASYLSFAMS